MTSPPAVSHEPHPLEDVPRLGAELLEALRRDFVAVVRGLGVPDRRSREVPRDALAAVVYGAERRGGRPDSVRDRLSTLS